MTLYGWTGKILDADLTAGRLTTVETERYVPKYIGGRGVAARLAWERIPELIDAFDPRNVLIFMTGPLTGTLAPTAGGRMTVTGVAPQAYPKPHYTRSSIGGHFGAELKYAGYDGLLVHGAAEQPVYLSVKDEEAELLDAGQIWGQDTFATQKKLLEKHGGEAQVVCIGPAGENLVRIAVIQSGLENAAAQGGFGAVMGSKRLKAVVVRGTGRVAIAYPERFREVCRDVQRLARAAREWRPQPGTSRKACTMSCTVKGCGDAYILYRNVLGRLRADPWTGVVQCASPMFLQLKPWEAGFEAAQLANAYGINHWEIALGLTGAGRWLDQCVEKGLLTEAEVGMPLEPKNGEFWGRLLRKIAYREGIGDIFAEGLPRAAEILNRGKEFLPHVAHGFETHWDGHFFGAPCYPYWLVSALEWALDSRDPLCHGYAQEITWWWDRFRGPLSIGKIKTAAARVYGSEMSVDPESGYAYKAQPAYWQQHRLVVKDSLPVCDQIFPLIFSHDAEDGYGDTAAEVKLFSAATGVEWTEAELDKAGERVFNLERAIMIREGRTRRDDEAVIPYFKRPDYQGIPLDEEKFKALLDELYELRGWDKTTGCPTKEKLEELGLRDVAEELRGSARTLRP
ncbi:MAG: aldehyde ferredoxin oxidoreductase N-terminal domain-containing protein [Candidatus Bathyarchaeia archaeon]